MATVFTKPTLFDSLHPAGPFAGTANQAATFKRLYYHLYSNSNASRAERIFADIAKLLLVKLVQDREPADAGLRAFLTNGETANETLLPTLARRFPKYISTEDRFTIGDDGIRTGLADLKDINLVKSPAAVLGDAFEALIGPRLRGDKGQFFTPRSLVGCMVKIADPKWSDKVVDPAAGTGGFLLASHAHRRKANGDAGPLIGLEKDRDISMLAGAMLEIATDGAGAIQLANSLDIGALPVGKLSPFEADIVLTNPPFGVKIGITSAGILQGYALGHQWVYSKSEHKWVQRRQVRASQDPQILFLELCIKLLKPGGLLGIVLPEGVFGNSNGGYVWDFLRSQGSITAMIDCPRTTFQPGTDTKTNVLFFHKSNEKRTQASSVLIAVAKHCGHDRRGRSKTTQLDPLPDDFNSIADAFPGRDEKWWSSCDLSEPYYCVPRFYHQAANRGVEEYARQTGGKVTTVEELIQAKHLKIRKGHEVGSEAYGTGEIPFVRTSDVNNWEVSVDPTNGVSEDIYHQYKDVQRLRPGDILLVVDGRYKIGRSAILHKHNCRCVVQSHLRVLTTTPSSPINAYELLFLLNLPCVLEEMRNLVFIQSTLGSLGRRLGRLRLPIPQKSDEWETQVVKFQRLLGDRAEQLATLQSLRTPEPEL